MFARLDHQLAAGGESLPGKRAQTVRDFGRQAQSSDGDTQLDRGRYLVDVLTARSGGAGSS